MGFEPLVASDRAEIARKAMTLGTCTPLLRLKKMGLTGPKLSDSQGLSLDTHSDS